ncbi:MFS transporter [Psychroserpens sp. NJDZ02]|uniref:MFS transporter n=1 Tax=Psychroserpens sp. NJDZ02 TaxID=2570561 RepID=UPI0010A91181|nr:MFS transporter [Psychroserpens sp. NJDZ02]QCE40368.1 MFS transporter [Psychroserpens sp. NJDZ02]
MKHSKIILPVIVLSQFCCTCLWFAGNGVINDLVLNFGLNPSALGHLTSAVQFGFIIGTLLFAILTIADRYSPSKVFFISALLGAFFNLCIIWDSNSLISLLTLRFLTGFFLAGIYPVGMKIATDYYNKGLGKSLGFLVGALVLGTAFPHLLKDLTATYPWKSVLITTSTLALFGGVLMLIFIPDGPFRKRSQHTNLTAFFNVFQKPDFRAAAFGYFGHMWELYTFWVFVPIILKQYTIINTDTTFNIPLLSFIIIGLGGLACIISGYIAQRIGTKKTAFIALLLSCLCCLISPLVFTTTSEMLLIGFLIFWGLVVVADSPLLSTLVAQNASSELKGTALTIVNCLGFTITIISIQVMTSLVELSNSNSIYFILALGPILGLLALGRKQKTTAL